MSYGDDEHAIGLRFEPRLEGGHIKVRVRCGQEGMRAYCGELTLRPDDWAVLSVALASAPYRDPEFVFLPTNGRPAGDYTGYRKISMLPVVIDELKVEP